MSISTKKGDKGKTSLYSGETISKSDIRIELLGVGDELITFIGSAKLITKKFYTELEFLQNLLFKINSNIATIGEISSGLKISDTTVEKIENMAKTLNEKVSVSRFIIPSENEEAARLDIARVIARKFERKLFTYKKLQGESSLDNCIYAVVNRMSDILFLMAREEGKS